MRFRDSIKDTIYGERISPNIWVDNNGQLICENVILARTGYYDYRESELIDGGSDEKIVKVYRSPEEVFNEESIRSMNFKPLVDDHPSDNVTPETVSYLQKGFMTNVRRGTGNESSYLLADIVVTDPAVIDKIRSGDKRELSVGYTSDIDEQDGKYEMKNIRGNHIALCEAGRAGVAKIRDSKTVADGQYRFDIYIEGQGAGNFVIEAPSEMAAREIAKKRLKPNEKIMGVSNLAAPAPQAYWEDSDISVEGKAIIEVLKQDKKAGGDGYRKSTLADLVSSAYNLQKAEVESAIQTFIVKGWLKQHGGQFGNDERLVLTSSARDSKMADAIRVGQKIQLMYGNEGKDIYEITKIEGGMVHAKNLTFVGMTSSPVALSGLEADIRNGHYRVVDSVVKDDAWQEMKNRLTVGTKIDWIGQHITITEVSPTNVKGKDNVGRNYNISMSEMKQVFERGRLDLVDSVLADWRLDPNYKGPQRYTPPNEGTNAEGAKWKAGQSVKYGGKPAKVISSEIELDGSVDYLIECGGRKFWTSAHLSDANSKPFAVKVGDKVLRTNATSHKEALTKVSNAMAVKSYKDSTIRLQNGNYVDFDNWAKERPFTSYYSIGTKAEGRDSYRFIDKHFAEYSDAVNYRNRFHKDLKIFHEKVGNTSTIQMDKK